MTMTNQQLLLEISKDISAIKQHLKDMNGSITETKDKASDLRIRMNAVEKYIAKDGVVTGILAFVSGAVVLALIAMIFNLIPL